MFGKLVLITPLALVTFGVTMSSAQEPVRHPRLHEALAELREARPDVKDAGDIWPLGQKEQALAAIDDAIKSLKTILGVRGDDFRGLDRNPDYYKQYKDHKRLRSALHDLREARQELENAKADFRDLRERALEDVEVAIGSIVLLLRK